MSIESGDIEAERVCRELKSHPDGASKFYVKHCRPIDSG